MQSLGLEEVVFLEFYSPAIFRGLGLDWISSFFRHSPRAARSCRSSCGRPGRRARSGPAGTPAAAAVSGRGCWGLAGCWEQRRETGGGFRID